MVTLRNADGVVCDRHRRNRKCRRDYDQRLEVWGLGRSATPRCIRADRALSNAEVTDAARHLDFFTTRCADCLREGDRLRDAVVAN